MVSRNEHARVQIFLTSNVNTRMQQQPVSNLFSSVAESKEIQTLPTEQLRTVEKITISFMQNLRLQQTGDTSNLIYSNATSYMICKYFALKLKGHVNPKIHVFLMLCKKWRRKRI